RNCKTPTSTESGITVEAISNVEKNLDYYPLNHNDLHTKRNKIIAVLMVARESFEHSPICKSEKRDGLEPVWVLIRRV
ncbi:hypothetical protein MUP01_03765, partial [Candidatus Bathyarchaeota archaeon]|nr:hypothetical protein [Candidatus Bathyarchaeota archaeon]